MSTGLDQLQLDDLNMSFFDVDGALKQTSGDAGQDNTTEEVKQFQFGPSKEQTKSFSNWDGCDGKFFFPHNRRSKLGRVSDFVTAAIMRAKEQEREAERATKEREDAQKRKEKKGKGGKEEKKGSEDVEVNEQDDEDGFTVMGEGRGGPKKQQQQGKFQKNDNQQDRRGNHWQARGTNPSKAASAFGQEGGAGKRVYVQGVSRRQQVRQNFAKSGMTRQLRSNLKDYAVDVTKWKFLKEYTRQNFERVTQFNPGPAENVKECGDVFQYDASWDRASGKRPKALKPFAGQALDESLFADPVMLELIEDGAADVYTTEAVASVLMCATKSNYSWDLEVKVCDGTIFIDKRAEEPDQNILNYLTVCETSLDHQPNADNTINGIRPLMREARSINDSWTHAAQNQNLATQYQFEEENPFIEDAEQVATRMGYVYKIWEIQQADKARGIKSKKICIRCQVHTHTGKTRPETGEREFMNVYAFNEHSHYRTNWRENIDNSVITCLNKEISDNSAKVSRWIAQALLAEADLVKFAFISRRVIDDASRHVVVGTHTVQLQSWASQMNITMDRLWGVIKYIVDEIEDATAQAEAKKEAAAKAENKEEDEDDEEGNEHEFILLKDFNQMAIRLYCKDDEDDVFGAAEGKA